MGFLSFFKDLFGSEPQPEQKKARTAAAKPARKSEVAEITERTRQQIKETSQRGAVKKETLAGTSETKRKPKKRKPAQTGTDAAKPRKTATHHETPSLKKKSAPTKDPKPAKPAQDDAPTS